MPRFTIGFLVGVVIDSLAAQTFQAIALDVLVPCLLLPLTAGITLAQVVPQFQDLSSTDGAQMYFSSVLRERGSTQSGHEKLFRLVPSGFQLFEEREYHFPEGGGNTRNYSLLI